MLYYRHLIVRDTIFIVLFPRNNHTTCARNRTRDAPETVTQTIFISVFILLWDTYIYNWRDTVLRIWYFIGFLCLEKK